MSELPVYESNKEMSALKIKTITRDADNCVTLEFEEEGHEPLTLDEVYCEKVQNTSNDMGYYAVAVNGDKSWMSRAVFDSIFTPKQQ